MKIDGNRSFNKTFCEFSDIFPLYFSLGSLRTKPSIKSCSLDTLGMTKPDNRV